MVRMLPSHRSTSPADSVGHGVHDHDLGLSHDLPTLLSRRRALGVIGVGVGAFIAGCGSSAETPTTSGSAPVSASASPGDAASIPDETGGPYPADGTNGPNVLASVASCGRTSVECRSSRREGGRCVH